MRAARTGRNPRTCEEIHIAAAKVPALKAALGLSLSDIHDTEPNAMPTYNITYFNAKQVKIEEESIFMKSLTNAKRSALHYAPEATCCIVIKDLMERTLSRYDANNGWTDSEA